MADDCTKKGVLEAAQDAYEAELLAEAIGDGIEESNGHQYMRNGKGHLVPIETIRPQTLLQDELTRRLIAQAMAESGRVAAFREYALEEIEAFACLLSERYAAQRGGGKGNISLTTHDQQFRVDRNMADFIVFGPELESSKALVMECLEEWTREGRPEARAVIAHAFETDKGKVRRTALMQLLALNIEDARWKAAMQALSDAMTVVGSKAYPRFYRKDKAGKWVAIPVDISAGAVS